MFLAKNAYLSFAHSKVITKFAVYQNDIPKMNYLQFLFRSTNQHGVHSPFVYNYLTKAIYRPYKSTQFRKKNFIEQSILYFSPKKIIDLRHTETLTVQTEFDLLVINPNQLDTVLQTNIIHHFKNDSIAIVDCRTMGKNHYKKIVQHPKVTVVLHFYWYIVFSVRQEQAKELFFLRL